jgi:hypothetical protein
MAHFVLRRSILKNLPGSILKKILLAAACAAASLCVQNLALAQHPGGHPAGGGRPIGGGHFGGAPRVAFPSQAPIGRTRVFTGGRFVGVGPRGFGFRQGQRVFFGRPFFRFRTGFGFNTLWWPNCSESLGWAWGWGFNCYPTSFYGFGLENNVIFQPYETSLYVPAERDLVALYLKDGTVYGVTDYWIVDGQLHFSMAGNDPTKPAEHVIPFDQLDVQKTTYVNSRRGFRMVARDEPWQQYLKDHPDLTPPDLMPPQNN